MLFWFGRMSDWYKDMHGPYGNMSKGVYKETIVNDSIVDSIKEKYQSLICGHWLQGNLGEDRKNISGALHCFFKSFKDKQRSTQPALILKTSGATYSVTDRWEIEKKIEQVRNTFGNEVHKLPPVYLLQGDFDNLTGVIDEEWVQ